MSNVRPFQERMRTAGMPELAIRTFAHYFSRLISGETGRIPEKDIQPLDTLPNSDQFPEDLFHLGKKNLGSTVQIKLNGGLGTSMGMEKAKSLLPVKDGLSFMDITARQALHAGVPLILMNSFRTQKDTRKALQRYQGLSGELPQDFVQHRSPKVLEEHLAPAVWPADPELEWAPPGHGDIYTAILTSGLLPRLLELGYEFAFISNIDNLGAVLHPAILGYMVAEELDILMEAADRTPADRKGGHLAQDLGGNLVLRESAQTPTADMEDFQNIERHRFFNTNNLWINLPALDAILKTRDGILGLPMIRNRKTLDPRDPASPPVFQLETAMGQAISIFEKAGAVRVARNRFAPVKSTNDLLAIRSDAYTLESDFRLVSQQASGAAPPIVELDRQYFGLIDDLESRFREGPPSLAGCSRLAVQGDIRFGAGVVCTGEVILVNDSECQRQIPPGARLSGD